MILAIISQRRGSIPYFLFLNLLIFNYEFKFFRSWFINLLTLFYSFSISIFLVFGSFIFPNLVNNEFSLNIELINSAFQSLVFLRNTNFFGYIFGISPIGVYRVIGLTQFSDNVFAWGNETGELFRYALWFLPGDRLILNVGFLGFIIYFLYICKNIIKKDSFYFYLLVTISPIFFLGNINPIQAFAYAFSFSFLVSIRKNYY
jgi:hypothetical protein